MNGNFFAWVTQMSGWQRFLLCVVWLFAPILFGDVTIEMCSDGLEKKIIRLISDTVGFQLLLHSAVTIAECDSNSQGFRLLQRLEKIDVEDRMSRFLVYTYLNDRGGNKIVEFVEFIDKFNRDNFINRATNLASRIVSAISEYKINLLLAKTH